MGVNWLIQHVGNRSPGSAGCSIEGGRAVEVYHLRIPGPDQEDIEDGSDEDAEIVEPGEQPFDEESPTPPDASDIVEAIHEAMVAILGTCELSGDSAGSLKRTVPMAHPMYPWMYASAILSIQGVGYYDPETGRRGLLYESTEPYEAPPITDEHWVYPVYRLEIEFRTRPDAILQDESIFEETINWYNESDAGESFTVAQEWTRYTWWQYEIREEVAFAQQGQLVYRRGDGTPGNPSADPPVPPTPVPHLVTCSGFPRIVIPTAEIAFYWLGVPIEVLTSANSPLVRYVGYINQLEWYGWAVGSLLYHGARIVRQYPPPVPARETWFGTTTFSTAKLVDLKLHFEETFRTSPSVPSSLGNRNRIAAGWNLLPYLNLPGTFWYATSSQTALADQRPTFSSVPFQILFRVT